MRHLLPALLMLACPVCAAPVEYALQPETSDVGFSVDFDTQDITGHFPIITADLTLDFDTVARSTIDVTLDVQHATANFPFAAEALKGANVLDARHHPTIHFASTKVQPSGSGALVQGTLTMRGVTRPITLHASIFRQKGHDTGDLSHLTVHLQGSLRRSAFGATGFADAVGDEVRLDIRARIKLLQ